MQKVYMDSKEGWISSWKKDLLQVTKHDSHQVYKVLWAKNNRWLKKC